MEHVPASSIDAAVRAGVAIFNDGHYHAAHDAWEDRWLDLERGTDDERFLHGLIQYTAAVYHANQGNEEGARGLAESARGYLDGLPGTYRGVSLGPVRHWLAAIAVDPDVVHRHGIRMIQYRGRPIDTTELEWPAVGIAAAVIADESDAWDEAVLHGAIERADDDDRFAALVGDFLLEDEHRGLIYERLRTHLERESAKDADVEGLFEESG